MPNNRDYWKQRMVILEESRNAPIQVQIHRLEKQYKIAQNNIEKEISIWYERFAENNQITISEAKKMLFADDLKEFRWNVEEYIKYGKENALDQKWMKELENASARVHISRLEALNFQMQHQIEVLYGTHIEKVGDVLKDAYSNDYYHTAYEIQKGFNIGWDLHNINQDELNKLLSKPWTIDRQTFSDRIWTNKQKLIGNLRTQLTQSVITGKSPKELIKNISEQMKVDRYKAGRLVMTESAAFASAGQKDCFNTLGVEKFEIVATLDSHTSEICQNLNGHVFDMKDYEIGVTAPPFHVWCRTVIVPYFVDNYGVRAARNAEGNTYYVPSNMSYNDWKKLFVNGSSKDGLNKLNKDGKISKRG
jgi:SPP1 gp7 family putative phage head morphogenesis protein